MNDEPQNWSSLGLMKVTREATKTKAKCKLISNRTNWQYHGKKTINDD